MNTPVRIRLLGGLSVHTSDRTISRFSTQKTASLLAFLAYYSDRHHPREHLIELLWPDADLDAGRNRLSTALSSLRRQLEPPGVARGSVIQADRFTVRLNPDAVRTDVRDFLTALPLAKGGDDPSERRKALERALRLYGGDLLPGYYDDWVIDEQRRLAAMEETARSVLSQLPTGQSPLTTPTETATSGNTKREDRVFLPIRFTRFFGRESEIERLSGLLLDPDNRLVTLTGFAGSGKTRTAIETASRIASEFPGFVVFVPLAALQEARNIPTSILQTLSIRPSPGKEPLEQAAEALNEARSLLILDNFEHLVEGGAPLLQSLMVRAPNLTCLVTSRQVLHLSAEHEYALPPLSLPDSTKSLELLSSVDSVRLFLDRAQHVRPDFQLTPSNALAIAGICARLEGMPLALELAAARAQVLTAAKILEFLEHRLEFLVSRRADVGDRHRSLKAAIDWSYGMLAPEVQHFFCKLSVFRGGWTLESAQEVCEAPQALEYLEQLHEASLVIVEETDLGIRFRVLETFREYADELLSEGSRTEAAGRHTAFYARLCQEIGRAFWSPDQVAALRLWDIEYPNLRQALVSGRDRAELLETTIVLANGLHVYWIARGLNRDGASLLDSLVGISASSNYPRARFYALLNAGLLHEGLCEWDTARNRYDDAQTLASQAGGELEVAKCHWRAAELARAMKDYDVADAHMTESLAMHERLDHRVGVADANMNLGVYRLERGDLGTAKRYLERSLALHRELGIPVQIGLVLCSLGATAYLAGDLPIASEVLDEALGIARQTSHRDLLIRTLATRAGVATELGDFELASHLAVEALHISRAAGLDWGIARSLWHIGDIAAAQSQFSAAETHFLDSISAASGVRDPGVEARARCSLAYLALASNRDKNARDQFQTCVRLAESICDRVTATESIEGLACATCRAGDHIRTAVLLGVASAARTWTGARIRSRNSIYVQEADKAALTSLGHMRFRSAWKRGEHERVHTPSYAQLFNLSTESG